MSESPIAFGKTDVFCKRSCAYRKGENTKERNDRGSVFDCYINGFVNTKKAQKDAPLVYIYSTVRVSLDVVAALTEDRAANCIMLGKKVIHTIGNSSGFCQGR